MSTNVYLLLDATGSMRRRKQEAIDACNEYLGALKADPHTQGFKVSMGQFNSLIGLERVIDGVEIDRCPLLTHEHYKPDGVTPLFDAIAQAIADLERRDGAKLLVIQTDGEENASQKHTKVEIAGLVKSKTQEGWQFVYLGCDLDAMAAAQDLGIPAGNTLSYAGGQSVGAYRRMAQATSMYAANASAPTTDFFNDGPASRTGPARSTGGDRPGRRRSTPAHKKDQGRV